MKELSVIVLENSLVYSNNRYKYNSLTKLPLKKGI